MVGRWDLEVSAGKFSDGRMAWVRLAGNPLTGQSKSSVPSRVDALQGDDEVHSEVGLQIVVGLAADR